MGVVPRIQIEYKEVGPLFTPGASEEIIERAVKAIEENVSEYGVDMVRNQYAKVFRYTSHPGRPRGTASRAVRNRVHNGHRQIHPGNIRYGAWLEGVGSMNYRTRFKGYKTFKIIGQQLQDRAVRMAEVIFQPFLRDLNGK
jgi:hypothetical protein